MTFVTSINDLTALLPGVPIGRLNTRSVQNNRKLSADVYVGNPVPWSNRILSKDSTILATTGRILCIEYAISDACAAFSSELITRQEPEVAMEAGLLVELRPNEENTLRCVARGVVEPHTLSPEVFGRLKALMLVEGKGEKIVLTELGKARVAALVHHQRYIDPKSSEFEMALSEALHVKNYG